MEDDSNGPLSDSEALDYIRNGVVSPIMAKFPEGNIAVFNKEGNKHLENKKSENDSYSSESDALVIDESFPKNQKTLKKTKIKTLTVLQENCENNELLTHSNPFFNESLFELSQLHQKYEEDDLRDGTDEAISEKNLKNKKGKNKPKAKLHEYAQYLGLQPAIQFKCSKCARSGFETLTALQEHIVECNEENVQEISTESSSSGFKLTRKVFLCSACGTYYENWNLYMHMLEIHQRFICLYCLGMFSILEDLCQHLQSKHSLQPGFKNTPDDFFNTYNEPCYLVCCECNKLFSEQDNFFYHKCSKTVLKGKKNIKTQITPENHVTGETEAIEKDSQNLDSNMEQINKCVENVNGLEHHETMETSNENVMSNNKPLLQEFNDNGSKTDNISHKSFEDDESLLHDSGHNEKFESEPLYDMNSKLESSDKEKLMQDSEEEMEDTQDILRETNSDYNEQPETRKVPKLSLKLPKATLYQDSGEDSDDSEKLTMDQAESDNEHENSKEEEIGNNSGENPDIQEEEEEGYGEDNVELDEVDVKEHEQDHNDTSEKGYSSLHKPQLQIAGPDIQIIELELEQPLDKFDPRVLLQKCLKKTVQGCIYCNHARKIAVNGKQLALHCIAEHRFSAVVNSITAEELIPESFVNCLTETLDQLETSFFSLESSFSNEAVTFSHLFECFQCYFSTTVHKELYLHNRKFHSKNLLLCIMCKSNFFSYSELICHLCPGVYVLNYDLQFRCCMCVNDDLPSSFRLMVHLRKKHNVCDVCLEMCHTQYKLSNHVWKHKLHHFCYRCGIAYRNKPDITRHLFWKHGTESVLCKKCLQKKWPHVYHFCVPPTTFTCDECGLNFTKAVSLKVHKRIHTDEKKHNCTFEGCEEKFISNKLRIKHEKMHYDPPEELKSEEKPEGTDNPTEHLGSGKEEEEQTKEEAPEEKPKPKIDVLDLPALNLSESDSSDSESENTNHVAGEILTEDCDQDHEIKEEDNASMNENEIDKEEPKDTEVVMTNSEEVNNQNEIVVPIEPSEELDSSNSVIQNIWNNFKNYQASKEKLDNMFTESDKVEKQEIEETSDVEISSEVLTLEVVLRDHDYCLAPEQTTDSTIIEMKPALTESVDHDYCSPKLEKIEKSEPSIEAMETEEVKKEQEPVAEENKSKGSSSSSSDSDSSSCSCGSNCSCSSSSGSSSSSSNSSGSDSSTEEGRKRQQLARKQRRKERAKKLKEQEKAASAANKVDSVEKPNATPVPASISVETPIQESDLETTESETDEEFYDKAPQKLAKKILEEKRQQLLSIMGPNNAHKVPNGSFIESTSRPPTPPAGVVVEEEERKKKKSKSKKRKKHRSEKKETTIEESLPVTPLDVPIPPYYQQFHQTFNQQQIEPAPPVAPISLNLSMNSPVRTPSVPNVSVLSYPNVQTEPAVTKQESTDVTLRASKRRRVPNKFYGYSSDEDQEKSHVAKWRKTEPPLPRSPLTVPPITIKTTPQLPAPPPQVVEPISIRTGTHLSDFRVQRPRPRPSSIPPIKLLSRRGNDNDSASDSNDSSSEEQSILPPKPTQPQLYCYCRCPYDEVSEMIGCDASDCAIEWFHFECVGIMVPPKGQWFCPDCRKKKQQRREIFQQQQNRQYSLGSQQSI